MDCSDLIFEIVTWPGSNRIEYITNLLAMHGINYQINVGEDTLFGWDGHRECCLNVIRQKYHQPYIIIAEDDLIFTDAFSVEKLQKTIAHSTADVICTGTFTHYNVRKGMDGKIYTDSFSGTQLVVIFKSAYDLLLNHPHINDLFFEMMLSTCGLDIEITLPFISTQGGIFPSKISRIPNLQPFIKNAEAEIIEIVKKF